MEYFLDEMKTWEVEELLDDLQYYDAPAWDRCRLLLHALISAFSKHKLDTKDILSFPWDDGYVKPEPLATEISNDDIKRLREQSQKFIKN